MLNQKDDNSFNSIIGIVLIFVILIGYSIYTQPTQEEIEVARQKRDSITALETKPPKPNNPSASQDFDQEVTGETAPSSTIPNSNAFSSSVQELARNKLGVFASASLAEEKLYIMENELIKVTLSSLGGRIISVQLKNYQTHDSLPLFLFKGDSSYQTLNFFSDNKSIATGSLYFDPIGRSFEVLGENTNELSFRLNAGDNQYIEFQYSLSGNTYDVGFDINFVGMQDIIASNTKYINMDWGIYVPRQEKSLNNERINTTIYYKYKDDEVDYLSETSDEREELKSKVEWVAFKQQFFSSILSAENSFDKPTYVETLTDEAKDNYVKQLTASFSIPFDHLRNQAFPMKYYFGPNHYNSLKSYGKNYEDIIPLGWGVFGWVNMGLIIPIFNFLGKFISSYGIIILIMTIFIKVLLFPLMYKSYLSTAKMRVLKPEVDAIGEKFPKTEDAMKKQQAVMALYKKTGVNPMGGCLPMLVQMPILIAMYRFFPSSIELRQEGFLWATDLSSYDSIYDFPNGFSIPFYGDHVSLFTLLMTVATLLSVKMNSEMSGGAQMNMPQMKVMMYLMPIMFLGFFNDFASALSYYYFVATMITFGQQFLMRRFVDEKAILAKIEQNKKKPSPKKSSFQKKMEKMAKDKGYKM